MKTLFAAALLAAFAFAPAAQAQDACDALMAAMVHQRHIASHAIAMVRQNGGAPVKQESILIGGAMYFKNGEIWLSVPMPPRRLTDFYQKSDKDVKVTCARAADEAIDGEAAAVYTEHAVRNNGDVNDNRTWLSKKTGLALKLENRFKNAQGTSEIVATFDYRNVKAPEVK